MDDEQVQDLIREAKREYHRAWRKRNPEKVRVHNQHYWLSKAIKNLKNNDRAEAVQGIKMNDITK